MVSIVDHFHDYFSQLEYVFSPPSVKNWDFENGLEAIQLQQYARITQVAVFIFSALLTAVTLIYTEAPVFVWPVAIPLLITTIASWCLFGYLNSLDEVYVQGLAEEKQEIATAALNEIFPPSSHSLKGAEAEKKLADLDLLLGRRIFGSYHYETLVEKGFQYRDCEVKQGYFGAQKKIYSINITWSPNTNVHIGYIEKIKKEFVQKESAPALIPFKP